MTLSIRMLCHYAECPYAECRISFIDMLNAIVLSVVLSVVVPLVTHVRFLIRFNLWLFL
jgi:hypothetical protein